MRVMQTLQTDIQIRKTGFTLLEIMVAVSIIAIVFTSVFRMHSQTLAMSDSVRFYTVAPLLAQKKLAEIDTATSEDMTDDTGDFGEDFPDFQWQLSFSEIESEILEKTAENLKRIDLTVSWRDQTNIYQVRTYRFVVADE